MLKQVDNLTRERNGHKKTLYDERFTTFKISDMATYIPTLLFLIIRIAIFIIRSDK